jgi:hypothetical protein
MNRLGPSSIKVMGGVFIMKAKETRRFRLRQIPVDQRPECNRLELHPPATEPGTF